MNKIPLIVSFATKNTPYEEVINNYLIPSIKKWNLKYDIDYIESKGNWSANICYKPTFLYKMLCKHKEPIVSLDSDAIIEQFPELFNRIPENIDIAAHILDWGAWYNKKSDRKELLGGTLYLNYNDKILKLLKEWIIRQNIKGGFPQRILYQLLNTYTDINLYELPLSYCYISTLPSGKEPFIKLKPVISQHQVSRKYRHKS